MINSPIVALVDDDKIFRLTASRTITTSNLTDKILQFENGEEALTFLKNHAHETALLPDYIFLDINMPLVDGWMFLDDYMFIKSSLKKGIIIYMVSSSIDPSDINRAKGNSDVTDYIIKPVSREKFIELLKRVAWDAIVLGAAMLQVDGDSNSNLFISLQITSYKVMGAIIKISKKSKPEDLRKALLKLASTKKSKKRLSDFYGALPNTFEDGLTYQQKQRNEWK